MLAVSFSEMEKDFRTYCARAVAEGETVRVALGDEKDVIILSLDRYDHLMKEARNAEYLAMLDRSINQLASGRGRPHELIEVEDDE